MLQNLTGWHALVILAVVLLVFGSTKLPALARSVGQSVRILKHEVAEDHTTAATAPAATAPAATATAPTPTTEAPVVRSAS